eukprot:2664575-Pleurochrysis_carterae.AAC.1
MSRADMKVPEKHRVTCDDVALKAVSGASTLGEFSASTRAGARTPLAYAQHASARLVAVRALSNAVLSNALADVSTRVECADVSTRVEGAD